MAEPAISNDALPEWDLTDLYPGPDSPELKAALADLERQATAFEASYQGRIGALSGDALGEAVRVYERIEELAEPWRPYRSIATWYLWRSLDPAFAGAR